MSNVQNLVIGEHMYSPRWNRWENIIGLIDNYEYWIVEVISLTPLSDGKWESVGRFEAYTLDLCDITSTPKLPPEVEQCIRNNGFGHLI